MDENDTEHFSKPATIQTLRQDIRDIKQDMAEVKLALKGPFPPKPDEQGLIGNMMYLLHTVDGRDEGLRIRIRKSEERLQRLEDIERESRGWIKGAVFVAGITGSATAIVWTLIAKYVLKL